MVVPNSNLNCTPKGLKLWWSSHEKWLLVDSSCGFKQPPKVASLIRANIPVIWERLPSHAVPVPPSPHPGSASTPSTSGTMSFFSSAALVLAAQTAWRTNAVHAVFVIGNAGDLCVSCCNGDTMGIYWEIQWDIQPTTWYGLVQGSRHS